MIRALVEQTFDSTKKYYVLYGLSTDTKPTSGLITGSEFHEVDTGTKYEFDEVGSEWNVAGITSDEIKDEIDAWLDDHPEATTTVLDGAISYAKLDSSLKGTVDDVADLKTEIQNKANVDGSYSSLTAGNAEQLVSTVGVEDKTPYLFRTTGGSADVGDRVKLSEITGGTVAWNQLVKNGNFMDSTLGWIPENAPYASVSASDGVLTVTAIKTPTVFYNLGIKNNQMTPIVGHKYLFHAEVNSPVGNMTFGMRSAAFYNATMVEILTSVADQWTSGYKIINCNGTGAETTPYFAPGGITGFENGSVIKWRNIFIIDLTAMFGSTIADYIYGLEQNAEGAGVAWFRKLFPKDYYAYDAGSLLSVKTTAHKEVGFNALNIDRTLGTFEYFTNTRRDFEFDKYYVGLTNNNYYNPNNISEYSVDAQAGTVSMKSNFNVYGIAFPVKVLPNTTYYCGKTTVNGAPVIGIGEYDINGNWIKNNAVTNNTFTTSAECRICTFIIYSGPSALGNLNTAKDLVFNLSWDGERDGEYEPYEANTYALDDVELRGIPKLNASNNLYYDGDSYAPDGTVTRRYALRAYEEGDATDGSTMITDGTNTVYKLTTPTTESAEPYQEVQVCNDFGTEEFVDSRTVPMPVGNSALYQANLRAKLEMAPDSPDGDGDYIVRQTDGLNEYVAVSDNSTISGLSTRCPACPTDTDGTFVLKATVSSGAVTYAWTAES